MDLKKYLAERKELVDRALEEYFAKNCNAPAKLKEAMLYSLRAGGKRLRPILAIASAEACGAFIALSPNGRGEGEGVLSVALALEMIHTFSLIHDDLPAMDNDDLRRGLPTNHKKFGEAVAILAGDALLAEAFACLTNFSPSPLEGEGRGEGVLSKIIRDIASATGACGMTGGQLLDLEAEGGKVSYDELRAIHKLKTGALITVSVTSGAKAAHASESQINSLVKYGEAIGLAFQITDDILDIFGNEKEMGKPVGSDVQNEKSTYPAVLGMAKSKKLAKELIDSAYRALAEFDSKADPLRAIARYIIERKS